MISTNSPSTLWSCLCSKQQIKKKKQSKLSWICLVFKSTAVNHVKVLFLISGLDSDWMREAELGVVSSFYICFLLGSLESQRYLMTGVQRNYFITSSETKQLHEGGEGQCADQSYFWVGGIRYILLPHFWRRAQNDDFCVTLMCFTPQLTRRLC